MKTKQAFYLVFFLSLISGCTFIGENGDESADESIGDESADESIGDESADESIGDDWSAPMGGTRSCWMSWDTCREKYDKCKDDCWWEAIRGETWNCSEYCDDIMFCVLAHEDEPDRCARYDYSFDPTPDSEALEVCEAAVHRAAQCGEPVDLDMCEDWAKVVSPKFVQWLKAETAKPCGSAFQSPPPSIRGTLGDELCATIDTYCTYYHCNPEWNSWVNYLEEWISDEVIAAARVCVAESICLNKAACLRSWSSKVWKIAEGDPPNVVNTPYDP